MEGKDFKTIVRVLGHDIDGTKKLIFALAEVKGIGINMAASIINALKLSPELRFGYLSKEEIKMIEDAVKNPLKYNIPSWLLNRQKDLQSGKNFHLIGPDLTLCVKSDIDLMKKTKSWKGIRHALGLKVRGQRTKTTGRKGVAVGVERAKLK